MLQKAKGHKNKAGIFKKALKEKEYAAYSKNPRIESGTR